MSTEFEPTLARSPSFMDSHNFPMLDGTLDYLQYDPEPASPSFGASMNLTGSPLDFHTLNLSPNLMDYTYSSGAFSNPPRPYSPSAEPASISPPTLTYHLSAAEMSSDETTSGRRSRDASSPSPVPYAATIPRSHRFNPIAVPSSRPQRRAAATKQRRSSKDSNTSDAEEEEEYQPGGTDPRREAVRRQRIESEQRRRDELRDGYARLKAVLPPSTTKSSKVSLLDRAASYLKQLESCRLQAETRLKAAEAELVRVRSLNEVLSLRAVQQREAAMGHVSVAAPAPQATF